MRQFQASDFSAERSGKCALFMPKELAFQQPSRNRRTVELDETAILSQTHTVDGASDEFLTRTRFPPESIQWHHFAPLSWPVSALVLAVRSHPRDLRS